MQKTKDLHNQTSDETLAMLETTLEGLSEEDAELRLRTFGPNKRPEPKQQNILLAYSGPTR